MIQHTETPSQTRAGFEEKKAAELRLNIPRDRGALASLLGATAALRPLESAIQGDAPEKSRRPRPV